MTDFSIHAIRDALDAGLGPNSNDWENDACFEMCHEIASMVGYPVDTEPEEDTDEFDLSCRCNYGENCMAECVCCCHDDQPNETQEET